MIITIGLINTLITSLNYIISISFTQGIHCSLLPLSVSVRRTESWPGGDEKRPRKPDVWWPIWEGSKNLPESEITMAWESPNRNTALAEACTGKRRSFHLTSFHRTWHGISLWGMESDSGSNHTWLGWGQGSLQIQFFRSGKRLEIF